MNEQVPAETFEVGEQALCVSRKGNGTRDCIVVEGLAMREVEPGQRGLAYIIEIPGVRSSAIDGCWNAYPWQLVKKRPLQVVDTPAHDGVTQSDRIGFAATAAPPDCSHRRDALA